MENNDKVKTPHDTEITMTELVLPNDTNLLGNLLGGTLMHWIDLAGAMAATKHSRRTVATVAVDSIDFRHPARKGEIVTINAKLTWVGRTSMEVLIRAYAENPLTGKTILANKAFFTFVALDEEGKPTPVPPLMPETEEEKKLYCDAEHRRVQRLRNKKEEEREEIK